MTVAEGEVSSVAVLKVKVFYALSMNDINAVIVLPSKRANLLFCMTRSVFDVSPTIDLKGELMLLGSSLLIGIGVSVYPNVSGSPLRSDVMKG